MTELVTMCDERLAKVDPRGFDAAWAHLTSGRDMYAVTVNRTDLLCALAEYLDRTELEDQP